MRYIFFILLLAFGCGETTAPLLSPEAVAPSLLEESLEEPVHEANGSVESAPASGAQCPCTEADLAAFRVQLVEATKKLSAAETTSAELRTKLQEADTRIAALSSTPEAVYADLVPRLTAELSSVAEADQLISDINGFVSRFPASPEAKQLRSQLRQIERAKTAAAQKEAQAKAMKAVEDVRKHMGQVDDGRLDGAASVTISNYLQQQGLKYDALKLLPTTAFAEAMKDPESERGKGMSISGRVIQISKDGDYFMGLLCQRTFCDRVISFLTPGTTRGIVQGRSATFAGIFTQRYSYPNSGGGTTHALHLVGYFKGQD